MEVAYRAAAPSHGDALRRERAIKKLSRAAKDALLAKYAARKRK